MPGRRSDRAEQRAVHGEYRAGPLAVAAEGRQPCLRPPDRCVVAEAIGVDRRCEESCDFVPLAELEQGNAQVPGAPAEIAAGADPAGVLGSSPRRVRRGGRIEAAQRLGQVPSAVQSRRPSPARSARRAASR